MSDPLAENRARLEQLLERMKFEKDFHKANELAQEIWEILAERERLKRLGTKPSYLSPAHTGDADSGG